MRFIFASLAVAVAAATGRPSAADLFARGDFGAAKAAYIQAARNPNNVDARIGLSRIELYDNQLDAAVKDAGIALAQRPEDSEAARIIETAHKRRAILASASSLGTASVVVPFVESEPLPAITMRVDGRIGTFVIDTGAPELTLDPEFAKELGLAVTGDFRGNFLGGRTATVREAVVPKLEVGPVAVRNLKASILPSRGMHLFRDRKVDGVVGTAFLMCFLSTMDYPRHRVVLRPRFASVPATPGASKVPIWLVGDHFIFARGSVNGLANQLFNIDSGGAGAGFMPAAATIRTAHMKAFPNKAVQGVGGGGTVTIVPTVAGEVCVGTACQKNVEGGYTPSGSPLSIFPFAVAGTVSHAFLERYAVSYDFARMQMTLTK